MLRRVVASPIALSVALRMCSSVASGSPYSGPIPGATGKDNAPNVYESARPENYIEKEYKNPKPADIHFEHEPKDRSDNIKYPEFDLIHGKFENPPAHLSGGPAGMRYNKYTPPEEPKETIDYRDVMPQPPQVGHHEKFSYLNVTGRKEGNISNMAGTMGNWDLKLALFSLYRACRRAVPMIKHFYWLTMPVDQMMLKVRHRFEVNSHVKDPDAIRHLLHNGWTELHDSMTFRRTRASIMKYFDQYDDRDILRRQYNEEEGQLLEERRFWNGEEQRSEGPYNGHWSQLGEETAKEFERIAGRIPRSWTTSKGYFEITKPDGTNYWEKNLDYEGWYIKNVDPDTANARREAQSWVESGYNQPKHYASKNRRAYRRFVKDIEGVMEASFEEIYSRNRELYFQNALRGNHPEANRVHAEKALALKDDEVYSTNWTEIEAKVKQVMREMPNPRMWSTDAFYLRYRHLAADLEYNWARVPIGSDQERQFAEWINDNVNYAIYNSPAFAALRSDKGRNPMALSWNDFYARFDPDVPETRGLPWYHPEFNYDRRHKWDEHCMRKKKWLESGDIDGKHAFFDSYIAEYEQYINRCDTITNREDETERRYMAPRMVQLYRALNTLMDVALASQLRDYLAGAKGADAALFKPNSATSVEKVEAALKSADLSAFKFRVPVLIYPDGAAPQRLALDGTPL